jgi:hypothetical protein
LSVEAAATHEVVVAALVADAAFKGTPNKSQILTHFCFPMTDFLKEQQNHNIPCNRWDVDGKELWIKL